MGVHQESDAPPIALINHNWALATLPIVLISRIVS